MEQPTHPSASTETATPPPTPRGERRDDELSIERRRPVAEIDSTPPTSDPVVDDVVPGQVFLADELPTVTEPTPGTATDPTPGASLVEEAVGYLIDHEWRLAQKMAESAIRVRGDALAHGLAAMAAARRLIGAGADVGRLHEIAENERADDAERATAHLYLGATAAAQHLWPVVDSHARAALDLDRSSAGAWWLLAASFAGLGWFDESNQCVAVAERMTASPSASTTEPDPISALGPWTVGDATNRWAVSRTGFAPILAVGFFVGGLLGAAVAFAMPFLVRDYRIGRLDEVDRDRADATWRTTPALRIAGATAAVICLALWTAVLTAVG